jgi:hypothetical protein
MELKIISIEKLKTKIKTGETWSAAMQELLLVRVQSVFHNFIELATSDVSQLYSSNFCFKRCALVNTITANFLNLIPRSQEDEKWLVPIYILPYLSRSFLWYLISVLFSMCSHIH